MHLPQRGIIELSGINIVRDNRTILSDINLRIDEGDFVAITGPNGGGKTTLLRVILGLISPNSGSITYRQEGHVVKRLNIGYLPQKNMLDSHFPISVREVIHSGLLAKKNMSANEKKQLVEHIIEMVGLMSHADSPLGILSGGQQQRALLGRAIVSNPRVLVLDEPLSYIDKTFEKRIYEIVADLARHTTILLVSHEMSTIAGMASRHLIVDRNLHECMARHHYIHTDCDS